ncbi:MAG: hypothetical protein ACLTBV_17100 [Enterocloster bolteae]
MMRVIQLPIIVPHVVVAIFMVNIFSTEWSSAGQNGLRPWIITGTQQRFPCSFMTQRVVGGHPGISVEGDSLYNLFCYCSDGKYQ